VLEGATPQAVDAAMNALGLPMGPYAMSDMAGLDIGYMARRAAAERAGQPMPDDWVDRVVQLGRKGQKTGAGVYDYPDGSRTPVPSPAVDDLIQAYRAEKGVQPREATQDDLIARLTATLANEGARILEEGIALRASDIDTIYTYGYGFPAYRGGPMHYASEQGLTTVVQTLERHGLEVAPLLRRLAQEGKTFAQYDAERAKSQT
jgi:3-hydroxyacyl-CoA dehydrogenase